MQHTHYAPTGKHRKGFTLTEVIWALAISVLLAGMVAQFLKSCGLMIFDSNLKLEHSAGVRNLASHLIHDSRSGSHYVLFPSFPTTIDRHGKVADHEALLTLVPTTDGQTGNLLLIVELENWPGPFDDAHIAKIDVFVLLADKDDPIGPLHQLTHHFAPGALEARGKSSTAILVEALSDGASFRSLDNSMRGMAGNGHLFTNYRGLSVLVNGQIVRGNHYRSMEHAFVLAITPRG